MTDDKKTGDPGDPPATAKPKDADVTQTKPNEGDTFVQISKTDWETAQTAIGTLPDLHKRIEGQSAALNRQNETLNGLSKLFSQDDSKTPEQLKSDELAQREALIAVREQQLNGKAAQTVIAQTLRNSGVGAKQAELFSKHIYQDNVETITFEGENITNSGMELGAWSKVFINSDQGQMYLPQKVAPQVSASNVGVNSGNGNKPTITLSELSSGRHGYSLADVRTGKVIVKE